MVIEMNEQMVKLWVKDAIQLVDMAKEQLERVLHETSK